MIPQFRYKFIEFGPKSDNFAGHQGFISERVKIHT